MKGGPWAEERPEQKIIMTFASLGFFALLLVPAFDRRFGWSHLPAIVVIAGNALMVIGGFGVWRVFCENSFTSARIELARRPARDLDRSLRAGAPSDVHDGAGDDGRESRSRSARYGACSLSRR